jgi:hypothetical protein
MFRRMTDRAIHKNVGRTPLDVGADWIARTAHAALRFLAELRRALPRPVLGDADELRGLLQGAGDGYRWLARMTQVRALPGTECGARSPRAWPVHASRGLA